MFGSPCQNGVAKRRNQNLIDMVSSDWDYLKHFLVIQKLET